MAHNQTGIFIAIKAFLPTGKTLDEQFAALSIVRDAHASGDYAALLSAATIDEVKTEQKTRRVEDAPAVATEGDTGETTGEEAADIIDQLQNEPDHCGIADTTVDENQEAFGNFADGLIGDDEPVADEPAPARRKRA